MTHPGTSHGAKLILQVPKGKSLSTTRKLANQMQSAIQWCSGDEGEEAEEILTRDIISSFERWYPDAFLDVVH